VLIKTKQAHTFKTWRKRIQSDAAGLIL